MGTLNGVETLERILDYNFLNKEFIAVAVSHPGFQKHDKEYSQMFERLEFLGDRVLGLALAKILYDKFPNESEGELAIRISSLAGTDKIISIAKKTKIIDCFLVPKDFFISRNKNSSSLADMMEAVIGAVFLDSNLDSAIKIILKFWNDDIKNISGKTKDSKTMLQEIAQSLGYGLPIYRIIKMSGKSHDPIFQIECTACEKTATGYGTSKKNAEHDAAKKILEQLKNEQH